MPIPQKELDKAKEYMLIRKERVHQGRFLTIAVGYVCRPTFFVLLSAVGVFLLFSSTEIHARNFLRVNLPHGVSLEVPRNWVFLSNNARVTLDTASEAMVDLSGIDSDLQTTLPFAANLYNGSRKPIAMLNVRYYPAMDVTQDDVRRVTKKDIREFDAQIKLGQEKLGIPVQTYSGTKKRLINGMTTLVTEYTRESPFFPDTFRVRLVRVLMGGRSFTLTVSYYEGLNILLQPITDKIISTLQVTR